MCARFLFPSDVLLENVPAVRRRAELEVDSVQRHGPGGHWCREGEDAAPKRSEVVHGDAHQSKAKLHVTHLLPSLESKPKDEIYIL